MVEGDNVYRVYINQNKDTFRQFLVPKNYVVAVLDQMHKSILSGHLGRDKTLSKINERFYWPKMYSDTLKYLQKCDKCQKIKSAPPRIAPLQPLRPKKPMELVTMDIAGPLPKSTSNNEYILVICDHFTKYTVCYAIPDQTAITIASKLVDYMCIFGVPDSVLTDQGRAFQSALLAELYDLLDVHKLRTSPFHPECNGITERFNQTMKKMLAAFINVNQDNWDLLLSKLQFAYNSSKHIVTGYSPIELMYGRKAKLPIDIFFNQLDVEQQNGIPPEVGELDILLNVNRYAKELKDQLDSVYKMVRETRDVKVDKSKINYDRKVRGANFNVGDNVLVLDTTTKVGVNKKLSYQWKGPYLVLEKINNVNYKLKAYAKRRKIIIQHQNRLKKFYGEVKPVEIGPRRRKNNVEDPNQTPEFNHDEEPDQNQQINHDQYVNAGNSDEIQEDLFNLGAEGVDPGQTDLINKLNPHSYSQDVNNNSPETINQESESENEEFQPNYYYKKNMEISTSASNRPKRLKKPPDYYGINL